MFLESLLENSGAPRRRWTTMLSFLLQAFGVSALVLAPLLVPQAMPVLHLAGSIVEPPPGPPPVRTAEPRHVRIVPTPSELNETGQLVAPPRVPENKPYIPRVKEEPPQVGVGDGRGEWGVIGGTGPTLANNIIDEVIRRRIIAAPPPPVLKQQTIRISPGVSEGLLISRVQPVYPTIAVKAGVQGEVVLAAVISREGRIENLRVVSGHPMLIRPAMDAVSQWRYRPYKLGDEPVEVETNVVVRFILNR